MSQPASVLVVAEAPADADEVQHLLDRLLNARLENDLHEWAVEQIWSDGDPHGPTLDDLRSYVGVETGRTFLDTHQIGKLAMARGLRSHGHLDGLKPPLEYHQARKAVLLAKHVNARAVIYLRDTDGESQRQLGWKAAAEEHRRGFVALVGGFPHEAIEAWRIALHQPKTPAENDALKACRSQLGFDPIKAPEDLSHKLPPHPRSAKKVAEELDAHNNLKTAPLSNLRSRGAATGLPAFVAELDALVNALLQP